MIEVLVTDDDALMRELLAEWLSEAGYRVRQAENGATAPSMPRRQRVSLFFTDMDLPDRGGVRILSEARHIQSDLPVIAISGGAPDENRSWAATMLNLGAAKVLAKPFERRDLLAAVEELAPCDGSGAARS